MFHRDIILVTYLGLPFFYNDSPNDKFEITQVI